MARVRRHELLGGGDHGGKSALHVGGAAAVEQPVADLRGKRVAAPLLERTRGHDVGVPGETQYRSEEHTSELQSRGHLVCRLLLEKKKAKAAPDDARYMSAGPT